jgi:predicted ATP-grasp superfamily ATP-dependent carboligase
MENILNALVASAQSPTALAVIRSLGKQGIEVTGAADSNKYFALFSNYCKHKIYLQSNSNDTETRVAEFLEIVKRQHFDVFLPVLPERVLSKLAKEKEEFEKYTKLPIPDYEQFEVFDDKSKTAKLMRDNNVPGPNTYYVENTVQINQIKDRVLYPVLIKPHRGEGSEGIKTIHNSSDLVFQYEIIQDKFGPCLIQEFLFGTKYAAVFLVNERTEPKRFFIHKCIREYPISGGPICCLESTHVDSIYEYGLRLLKAINYCGLAQIEFIVDDKDQQPKITEINPRFYGCIAGAISAGVDFPYAMYRLAIDGRIGKNLDYKKGVKCRSLLFEDTKHLLSVLSGAKSPKYKIGKLQTLINYLKFYEDDAYFILSMKDPLPALIKTFHLLF